jgi:hypothetical protein
MGGMDELIAQAFASGALICPTPQTPDTVHLVRAIASSCGVEGLDQLQPTQALRDEIGRADHYLFVLLDGLGMNLIRRLEEGAFLRRHFRREILAVCPSTTACALTSVATAHWPAQHAATGWFTHVAERGFTMTTLPFVDRFANDRLTDRGLGVSDILPLPAVQTRMNVPTMTFLPISIQNTAYARYSRGDCPASGYDSIPNAIDQVAAYIATTNSRAYTHLYIPDVDTACHHHGTISPRVMEVVGQIDEQLQRLATMLTGRARMVISADHGLIDVPVAHHMSLFHDDPLMRLLEVPPSGDARLPVFHLKQGARDEFATRFHERFGHSMRLLSTDEAAEIHLFGPEPFSRIARGRFGDFIGIAIRNATLHYVPHRVAPVDKPREPYLAQHAGLSPDEMQVPLVIA